MKNVVQIVSHRIFFIISEELEDKKVTFNWNCCCYVNVNAPSF